MAATKSKVNKAQESADAANASSKGKAKKPAAAATEEKASKRTAAPKEPVSDKELESLYRQKEQEESPREKAKLRRQIRAALQSRGEYVPRAERPKKSAKAKAKQSTSQEAEEQPKKASKSSTTKKNKSKAA